jgi:hypothetical protein
MKKLLLNRGRFEVLVDDEDYDDIIELPRLKEGSKTIQLSWVVIGGEKGNGKYRVRTGPHKGPHIHLHHFIMCPSEDECVIFRSDNTLDLRKENMTVVPSCAVQGTGRRRNSHLHSSEYRGVAKCNDGWTAIITYKGKTTYLGYYLDELHAARIYDIKAKEFHGELATLNNVSEDIVPVKCKRNRLRATSQYVGVYLNKSNGHWCAMIRVKGKREFLGSYVEEIQAARAYDIKAREYRGPDEPTNNIDESVIPVRGKRLGRRPKGSGKSSK